MRSKLHLTLLAVILGSFGFATTARAADETVLDVITGTTFKAIMAAQGYNATQLDEDGDLLGRIEGVPFYIIISQDKHSMVFRYSASGSNATVAKCNQWNLSKKYSRAYMDKDGDPVLELDLDLEGGVTVARIKDYILTCKVSMIVFRQEVVQ